MLINKYEIKEPVWKDNSIGIAEFRLKNDLIVNITYKNKNNEIVFPDTYIIKNHVGEMKYSIFPSNNHRGNDQNGFGIHS